MSSKTAIKMLNSKVLQRYNPLRLAHQCIFADTIHRMQGLGLLCPGASPGPSSTQPLLVVSMIITWFKMIRPLSMASRPLGEFSSLRKKPEDRGGLFPVWGYPWVQPENTMTQSQAENRFWRWVSLKNLTVQVLKERRDDRLLSYVLNQRDLRIGFNPLIDKRQLHAVMEERKTAV
ncbi:hypothetical protein PHPALM_31396 [Phytophthora palmivora]|uniref:ATP-binding cassette (ABC) Superfamily n=1 Tax=Phytophthora palmivora TaxID=4796 RepID=A0A2P4X2Q4_9STRA|nr:hypothetical protein PHPALM_31396 [Phytophthora palmivora]